MSRYDQGAPGDEQYQPGSNHQVLRNKLGLTDPEEADRVEANLLVAAQAVSYSTIGPGETISVARIQELHRSWLGSLYFFAGEIRTVNLAKDFVTFAPVAYLPNTLRELDSILAQLTPCRGKDLDETVRSIAKVHAELVLAHPFREGNGRVSRWVADLMALQAGLPALEWGFDRRLDERRAAYFAALRRGFAMDYRPLEDLVRKAIEAGLQSSRDLRD